MFIAAAALAGFAAAPAFSQFEQVWRVGGLATPESVLYAPALDAFLVANINEGAPMDMDGDGYIARLSLDGELDPAPFAEGLNAPKGMAATDDRLYVSDVNALVEIDLATGDILTRHVYAEAEFLNDVTIGPDGTVYVSDMGRGEILALQDGALAVWSADERLASVNGLLAEEDRLLAMAGDALVAIDWETGAITPFAAGFGRGDGMVADGRGGYLATQWAGRIFHVSGEGAVTVVSDTRLMGINSADPGVAPDAGLFAVPTFFSDGVLAVRFAD